MDILGKIIEAVSHENLDSFFEKYIYEPLGIKDFTFFLNKRPDLLERFADLSVRDPAGEKVVDGSGQSFNVVVGEAMGGGGLFGTGEDYIKILESYLKDDGKLLKSETAELLFTPQFKEDGGELKTLMETLSVPLWHGVLGGGTPFGAKRNWGLGGMIMMEDAEGGKWRMKGTLSWGGMPNINWVSFSVRFIFSKVRRVDC